MNNIEKNHAAMVNGNSKSGEDILNSMSHSDMHLLHMAVGICGEAGELIDAIKKACVYNKPLDRENAIEELGDIEFYLQGIRAGLNVSRDEVLQANIDKLEKRYPKGYTDKAAQDRVDKALTFPNKPIIPTKPATFNDAELIPQTCIRDHVCTAKGQGPCNGFPRPFREHNGIHWKTEEGSCTCYEVL